MGERKLRDIIGDVRSGVVMETLQCEYRYRPFASAQLFTGIIHRSKLCTERSWCYATSNSLPLYFMMTNPSCVQRDGSAFSFNVACGVISVLETAHNDFSLFICTC